MSGLLRAVAVGVALVGAALGCQVIVPGDVPDFSCSSADPSACPSGMVCDQAVGLCVSAATGASEGGDEAGEDLDAGDAGDRAASLAPLGAECIGNVDCKSGLCGTSSILTTSIITTNSKPVCTQTCCISADCPAGFVCFGAGTGGNYCVEAAKARRTTPGSKTPGAPCLDHDECRSGLCTAERCLDTCCVASDCAAGTTCRVTDVSFPPPVRSIWACGLAPAGTRDAGASCTTAEHQQCKTNNCIGVPARCTPSCCTANNCTAQGFSNAVCAYGSSGSEQLKWCYDEAAAGTAALGASCVDNFDCKSLYCEARKCALPCCRDADCPANNACRPSPGGTPFLRCVAK